MTSNHHYSRRVDSYSFWFSTLAKAKQLEKESPDVAIKYARSSRENVLQSLRTPEGEEVVIVSSAPRMGKLKDSPPTESTNIPINYPFPYETQSDPNNLRLSGERERFMREFGGVSRFTGVDDNNATYMISENLGQALVDLNDPKIMNMRNESNLVKSLLKTVAEEPDLSMGLEPFRGRLDAEPKAATLIAGVPYNVIVLRKITNVLEQGNGNGTLNFYKLSGLGKPPPIAVSDGSGHFVVTAAVENK